MGTWGTGIKENDTTLTVYTSYLDLYNKGEDREEIQKSIYVTFKSYFNDIDDKYDALFGLAIAQWETQSLNQELYNEITKVVESEVELDKWSGSDIVTIKKRKKVLLDFVRKLSKPYKKTKIKKVPQYTQCELLKASSPKGFKSIIISETYCDDAYLETNGYLDWNGNGGQGVFSYSDSKKEISAYWKDESTLIIVHESNIIFNQDETTFFLSGDSGEIIYKSK